MPLAFKYALRQLAKASVLTITSILMLALGIAMSTATFSITNSALLRPHPLPRPEELVRYDPAG